MDVILSGQITAVLPVQQGVSQRTGQPWVSQEYVLCHEPGQYPKSVCFRVFGEDKIKQMNIQMGEQLSVHLNIDCKQGQKGYFNSIDCWKAERAGQQMQQQVQQPMGQQQAYQQQPYQQQPMQAGYQQQMPQQGYQQQAVQSPFPQQQPMQQQVATPFPQQGMQQEAVPF